MKTISSNLPHFLTGIPNVKEILSCFTGGIHLYRFTGPHRFYRAAGHEASGQLTNAYSGRWWIDEGVLLEIANRLDRASCLSDQEQAQAWPAQFRALTAVSEDWNDFSEIFELKLPPNESIEGLAGIVKTQPQYSVNDPHGRHNPNRVLLGGGEQVFFKVKNPLWIERVHLW